MRRGVMQLLGLTVLLGASWGFFAWYRGDERTLRREMAAFAEAVSFTGGRAPLAVAAGAAQVAGYFTADASVSLEGTDLENLTLNGRDEIQQAAASARARLDSLAVQFTELQIQVAPQERLAVVETTAVVNAPGLQRGQQTAGLRFHWRKTDAGWVVHRVEGIPTLVK